MFSLTYKILNLLNMTGIKSALLLFSFIFFGMFLELIGIALIIPVISFFVNPELSTDSAIIQYLDQYLVYFNFENKIIILIFFIILIYLLKNILLFLIQFYKYFVLNKIQVNLSEQLFNYYMNEKYSFHLKNNSAYLVRNLTTEIPNARGLILNAITCYTELLLIFFLTIFLIYFNSWLGFYTIIFLTLPSSIIYFSFKKFVRKLGNIRIEHAGLATKQILEGIGGIKDAKIYSKENYFINKYKHFMKKFNRSDRLVNTLNEMPRLLFELIIILTIMSLILFMTTSDINSDKILVSLGVFAICLVRMMPSFNRLVVGIQVINFHRPSFEKIYSIFADKENEYLKVSEKPINRKYFEKKIHFNGISFFYDLNHIVLNKIDFEINKKDSIGIYGSSGSGKSTLINIILGFLKKKDGEIFIDSQRLKDHENLKLNEIGHVPQTIYLLDTSIKENIAFGIDPKEIDNKKIEMCLKLSKLDEFVLKQKQGVDTIIGENGIRLSGGQRQRIGIARALYSDPKILIFDEATNSLDNNTEDQIMNDIYKLKNEYTLIIVSHNLYTLDRCNKLYEMNDGKLNLIKKEK